MKIFILIMLYYGGSGSGQGNFATAEFNSKAACENAITAANDRFNSWSGRAFYAVCVPKD